MTLDIPANISIVQIFSGIAGNVFPAGVLGGIIILLIFAFIMIKARVPLPFALMGAFMLLFGLSAVTGDFFTSIFYLVAGLGFGILGLFLIGIIKRGM
jgi:hypothetical protein